MNIQKEIKTVLFSEAENLRRIGKIIGPQFNLAVNLLYRCQGKIIITGIGKSGLIARKIASTFSSTGTPSMYLHPAEAMHGNLGAVQRRDIVFMIGKSGESEEVLAILPSLRKIGVKIISLTSNPHSTMAEQSSVVLSIPIEREICPLNLAPTTSSTSYLVIGDAIAITLMKMRGFNKEKFALYHPGGILGKRLLLTVGDVMRKGTRNPLVRIDKGIKDLLEEISNKWTGAASIVDKKGRFVGLVTDFDIRKKLLAGESILELSIKNLMNPHPIVVQADEMVTKAVEIMEMRKKPITVLPVIDENKKAIGMLHLHDLIQKGLAQFPG